MKIWQEDDFTREEIELCLQKIREMRKLSPDGSVSYSGWGYRIWISVLKSALKLNVPTDALRTRIVGAALSSSGLGANFTEEEFRAAVSRSFNKIMRSGLSIFYVVFPIWNQPPFLRGRFNYGDAQIDFGPSQKSRLNKMILKEREVQRADRRLSSHFTKDWLSDLQMCSTCIVRVSAHSETDAYERANKVVCEILGLLNLALDVNKYTRSSFRMRGLLPVSEVLLAPHITVHNKAGAVAGPSIRYYNWVGGPTARTKPEHLAVWQKRYERLLKGVKKSRWQSYCKEAAERYFVAFSNPNLEESFLDGWRLLENVAGGRSDKIDLKRTRASNAFADSAEYSLISKHLGIRRNLISHGRAIRANDEETLAFQMCSFVHPFVELFIMNGFNFTTVKEFWELLELPARKDERENMQSDYKRKLSLLNKAARFRKEGD